MRWIYEGEWDVREAMKVLEFGSLTIWIVVVIMVYLRTLSVLFMLVWSRKCWDSILLCYLLC